tara:strand:- start:358 stop:510 length:153 start_codon:yes stop_codon:yes gene_type:complete
MLIGTLSASIGIVVSTITGAKPDDVMDKIILKAALDYDDRAKAKKIMEEE